MGAEDYHGIYIDQMTNPYTGTLYNAGVRVDREIRTPSGDLTLGSIAYDSHFENYCGLKNTTLPRAITTIGGIFDALVYGDFEGLIADYGYILAYGLEGVAVDEGKDLSSGNTRRWTFGLNFCTRNEVEVNKPSGAIELRAYGVNIDYVHLLPTLIAGTLTAKAFGLYANVLGNTLGDSVAYGVYTKVSGADKNYGYYSENPSLRLAPITAVPTDTPDEGTCRFFGPVGGPYKIYIYLDGAWRDIVGLVAHDKTYHIVPSLPDAEVITDAQHGSRGSGLHADSHARLHDHSLAADGSPIAVAGVPDLPASKITSEILAAARGGLAKALSPTWTNDYIPVYKTATDTWVMEAKPTVGIGVPNAADIWIQMVRA